jgi:hypothetical protein
MQDGAKSDLEACKKVDKTLREIARRRAQLDVVEARFLREALALEIWIPLGMVSALDYLERVLDYQPHVARERLRVAVALAELPELEQALAEKALQYSAVRELTRIAIPKTESEWIAAAKGRTHREVEMLVSGREKGSRPSDPSKPDLRPRSLHLKLAPDVYARFRQVRVALEKEHGRHLDDNDLIAALANAYLDGPSTQPTERARHQIALTVCEGCRQGWQEGGGQRIAVDAAAVERAECDAQHIGSIHAEVPARSYQDISPAVRRLVKARDADRCRIPGCRSARNIDLHHLEHRADGGGHDPSNIICVCGSCHRAIHDGRLIVSGTATNVIVRRPNEPNVETDAAIARELDAALGATSDQIDTCPRGDASPTIFEQRASATFDRCPTGDASPTILDEPRASARSDGHPTSATFDPRRAKFGGCPTGDASANRCPSSNAVPDEQPTPATFSARSTGNATTIDRRNNRNLDRAILRSQVRDVLVGCGWKPAIALRATDAALAESAETSLEKLIAMALRFCVLLTRG